MSLLDRPGLALYTVPVAFLSALTTRLYAISLQDQLAAKKGPGTKGYQNAHPRSSYSQVVTDPQQTDLHRRIIRTEGAQINGFEGLGPFAAAVAVSQVAKLSPRLANSLALAYIASRIIYNTLYINVHDEGVSRLRTVVWLFGSGISMALFVLSGNAIGSPAFKL